MIALALTSAMFLACPDDTKDDTADTATPGDTADTNDTNDTDTGPDDGYVVSGETTAAAALVGAQLPGSIFVVTMFNAGMGADCPVVLEVDQDTTTITGGCTDDNGTAYEGLVTLTQTSDDAGTADYDAWIVEDAGGTRTSIDGLVDISLVGDALGLGGSFLGATYRDAGMGVPTEVSYTYTDWNQPLDADFPLPAGISTGGMTIDGTAVAMTGTWDITEQCTSRPTSGALVVSGGNVTTFDFEGGCAACVPWTADDGASGEWCPE